jgi:hypothetical protein
LIKARDHRLDVGAPHALRRIDQSVSGDDSEGPDIEATLVGDKRHQPPQPNEVAEQLLDIKVVAVHCRQHQGFRRAGQQLKAQEAEALAVVPRVIDIARRIEQG